jgi:4-hydroxybenzoate polyprenyltransferase
MAMIKRIAIYLNEMFPITVIIGSIVTGMAIQLVYIKLHGITPVWGLPLILPGLVLTLISLLLRIMDEFKDYQDDLILFPNRPLPSGKVKKTDLSTLAGFCVMMVIFLSSTSVPLLLWGLVTLCFTGLMYKWFFMEEIMRKSLPLAFFTHHPIVIFNFVYLIIACIQIDPAIIRWNHWYYVLPISLMYTNWEVMRKIRAPEQETSYTTYSKIMGARPAILVALLLQIVFNLAVLAIFRELRTPIFMQIVFVLLQLALAFSAIKFLFTLKLKNALKPNAEGQILLVVGFLFAAALI